ncbi:MAG: hypothetical protein H7Z16_01045 [Pyrinomonadaceae bacterium]|nr:hypothetical protein [Pyrinomonadaceae bacterium]
MSLNLFEDCANAVETGDKNYEKHLKAFNLSRLLAEGEADVSAGRVRSARSFLRKFKNAHKISGKDQRPPRMGEEGS